MTHQKDLFEKTVTEQFNQFDRDNPKVYELFKKKVFEAIKMGKKKTSSKMILNLIRWTYYLETKSDDEFKINDRYTSHFARKFAREYPEHREMFNYRRMRKD